MDPGVAAAARERMVREQIAARGVSDPRVLRAMREVPRHLFVPAALRAEAHDDRPLAIGAGQTISQPYIVAAMAEALELRGGERVLEVGSGSGYMAAVLGALAGEVVGLEREPGLHVQSVATLAGLGAGNVELVHADGARGWPERAPYAAIVLSCAAVRIPPELWEQLAPEGRILLPLGPEHGAQELVLARQGPGGRRLSPLMAVRFVPLR